MITLDFRGSKPIYEQIIEQMKRNILKGYLKEGDAIPSVRRLALTLDVTPGTIAKAYQELERQHLIETIRGKGTFVAKVEKKIDERKMEEVIKEVSSGLLELKLMGMPWIEVEKMLKKKYQDL